MEGMMNFGTIASVVLVSMALAAWLPVCAQEGEGDVNHAKCRRNKLPFWMAARL